MGGRLQAGGMGRQSAEPGLPGAVLRQGRRVSGWGCLLYNCKLVSFGPDLTMQVTTLLRMATLLTVCCAAPLHAHNRQSDQ